MRHVHRVHNATDWARRRSSCSGAIFGDFQRPASDSRRRKTAVHNAGLRPTQASCSPWQALPVERTLPVARVDWTTPATFDPAPSHRRFDRTECASICAIGSVLDHKIDVALRRLRAAPPLEAFSASPASSEKLLSSPAGLGYCRAVADRSYRRSVGDRSMQQTMVVRCSTPGLSRQERPTHQPARGTRGGGTLSPSLLTVRFRIAAAHVASALAGPLTPDPLLDEMTINGQRCRRAGLAPFPGEGASRAANDWDCAGQLTNWSGGIDDLYARVNNRRDDFGERLSSTVRSTPVALAIRRAAARSLPADRRT